MILIFLLLNTKNCISIHMKRFSKKWFSQIMIHKKIKQELDSLKEIVRIDTNPKRRINYADVISFLIKHYKNSLSVEYPLSQGVLVGNKLEKKDLSVSIHLERKSFRVSSKLDGKSRVSYTL